MRCFQGRHTITDVMSYRVVIHAESAGGYWAEVPALPGCFSQGETVAELQGNILEAIELHLDVLRAEGREPGHSTT